MTPVDDYSMFGPNFGLLPPSSQPHLDNLENFSFAVDPANTAASCSHTSQTVTASNYNNEIEGLKREITGLKRENESRMEKIDKLHEMFLSLTDTAARQGIATKQLIVEMSPERSKSFFRGFNEELHEKDVLLLTRARYVRPAVNSIVQL
ncbi:hypothetical protein O988_06069 [Pseudogymnoascus sp. VKM F-3808]|nr:hypothetical protein O988_06069 [Pseudogymnoascus sp. VKM F-3808]